MIARQRLGVVDVWSSAEILCLLVIESWGAPPLRIDFKHCLLRQLFVQDLHDAVKLIVAVRSPRFFELPNMNDFNASKRQNVTSSCTGTGWLGWHAAIFLK